MGYFVFSVHLLWKNHVEPLDFLYLTLVINTHRLTWHEECTSGKEYTDNILAFSYTLLDKKTFSRRLKKVALAP